MAVWVFAFERRSVCAINIHYAISHGWEEIAWHDDKSFADAKLVLPLSQSGICGGLAQEAVSSLPASYGKDLRQAECWKLRQRSLGIATAALQNGCHGSLQKQLELAGPGHSMHLWTHWNVVEAILVKNMLKWGRWCEVVMQRSSDFMQLKTYSEGQIYTEKMHTI